MLRPPLLEESPVTQRQVLGVLHSQPRRRAINPIRSAFELGVVADRRLIDDAVALVVAPLTAPFLVTECRNQSQRKENRSQRLAIRDLGLGFNAVLVPVFARARIRQPLVGQRPYAAVAANAQDLG